MLKTSVADPGCLSRIRIFSIPDPHQTIEVFLHKKLFLSSWQYDPGCSSQTQILDFFLSIPDPGAKKAPDPGSVSATLLNTPFKI